MCHGFDGLIYEDLRGALSSIPRDAHRLVYMTTRKGSFLHSKSFTDIGGIGRALLMPNVQSSGPTFHQLLSLSSQRIPTTGLA